MCKRHQICALLFGAFGMGLLLSCLLSSILLRLFLAGLFLAAAAVIFLH